MMTKTYQMMPVLTNKTPFWLSGIALCLFLSCDQNVIFEPTATVQKVDIEPVVETQAVKQLSGCRRNLSEVIFLFDYNNIGTRILNYLTAKDRGQLRATCTEMGLRLLQKERVVLHVTPNNLRSIQLYRYVRLYPHERSPQDGSLTFHPIPVDAMVRGVGDWQYMSKDERLLIKNVVFIGKKARTLKRLREALPPHLIDHLIVSEKILAREKEILTRIEEAKQARKAAQEASSSPAKPAEEPPFEDPYSFLPALDPQPILRESAIPMQKEASSEDIYEKFSEEKLALAKELEYSSSEEAGPPDIANQLYDSFVGVKKLPAGKVTIGDYLAQGAFCKVFRGQWGNKKVALKQIDLDYTAKERNIALSVVKEAVQWEVTRLSTINHPNLVQFYGLYQDKDEDYTYMVMEFCEGGTLEKALEKKDVPWSQRWQWSLQISEALAYLHREGVLHRDLKAENILLDKNGTAKLADLGLAHVDALLQESEAKLVAASLGDRRFRAPEVEARQTLGTKETDIYALGLVFWQIASGKVPSGIREQDPIPADCPESFKQLMLECGEKEPNQRPTAQNVIAKLTALGPELDPYHHRLVTAAQRLEKLVHPKRKEGLAYIPPFVTQYSVDESIETYWNRIEAGKAKTEAAFVIPAEAGNQLPKAKEEANANPPLTLSKTFKEFIETPNSNTLLLLGETGLGKTLTTYQWGDQLLKQWWAHINTGTPAPAYFPIFIRSEVPTWSYAHIKDAFQEVARKYNLPQGIQPLLFVDGYDELQTDKDAQPTNLVSHLGLPETRNTKLIVTCRPNVVEKSALESRFGFNGALTIRYFLPFSLDQLLSYLQQELSWDEKVYQDYKKTLGSAESVRTVLRNPFVLHLFRESWETLSQKPLVQLNRWQIYEGFIEHSVKAQQPLLSKKVQERLQGSYLDLLASYQAFMSEVAWRSFQQKGTTLGWEEAMGISPWAQIKLYAEEDAKDEFVQRQAQQQKALAEVPEAEQVHLGRRNLLSETDYVRLTQKKVGQVESELPLQLRGEGSQRRYEYSHKSLFEYGMAKRLLLLQQSPQVVKEGIVLLGSRKIQEEAEAIQFWQEGWKESRSDVLIDPFFNIITLSREEEAIEQASANSATLLVQAGVPFSGRSLQGVRLPGADLSGAILSHTSLAGAQLPGALLRGTYVGNADLREANLSNVDFGQYPSLECKNIVLCLNYNPTGTQLAVGLGDGRIALYNKEEETYTPLATLAGHTDRIRSVMYHPDGQQLASGSEDHMIGIWDTNSLQLITWLTGHTGWVTSVTYHPDGKQLASGSEDHTVGLWDTDSLQLVTWLKGHTSGVTSVSYHPDGKQLASGSEDNTIGIWDTHSQQLIKLQGHTKGVTSVVYRPDGKQLASGSEDHTVGLWDTSSQQLIKRLQGHAGTVYSVAYRPDGKQLTSGSDDRMVGLWDSNSLQLITLLKGHTDRVTSVSYHPDGEQLASGSNDSTLGLWDPNNLRHITLHQGHTGPVTSVFYRPDDKQLASGSKDNTVGLWDQHRRQLITLLKEHTGLVWSVAYRPDGQQLASGSEDNTIGLWDPHNLQFINRLQGHTGWVNSVAYGLDGQQLVSGSNDNTVGLWDTHSQQLITKLQGHTKGVTSVAYRSDGQQLASGSEDYTVGFWDPRRLWHLTQREGHTKSVTSVAYRPDGKQLASGSKDKTIGLWDLRDPRRLLRIAQLKGHTGGVVSVSYRPDGKQLASGSKDRTIRFWDPSGHKCITLLQGHTGTVTSVAYRSDGNQLASGSDDQAIFIWAKQDASGSLQENWQLIRRFENTSSLWAPGALLKGATISGSNRALLKQKGADVDSDE